MIALKQAKESFSKKLLCMLLTGFILYMAGSINVQAGQGNSGRPEDMQQDRRLVTGVVLDRSGQPLVGVSVAVQGTTIGTMTDIDGKYSIEAISNQKLKFTYVGHEPIIVEATNTIIDVTMKENVNLMEDVIVVGFGVQKRENLTGAVSTVDINKAVDSRPISDVGRALQGAVPGLTITTKSGEIGSTPNIRIRGGVGSPNSSSKPLILVDNVEISDITLVNPDDIESMSVLKDAASASIYGVRAAFGVILITTKAKNKSERFSVSYSNNFAWRTPTKKPEQLAGWQQAEINLAGVQRAGANYYDVVGNMRVDQKTIDGMKAWAQQYGNGKSLGSEMVYGRDFEIGVDGARYYRTWDWYDMYIKDWMPQQTHNLSMNGGNGTTNYSMSLGYLHQEGLTKSNPDKYDRYNTMLTLNTQATKWLNVRANVMYTKTDMDKPFVYGTELYDHMYYLYRWQPMYPYGTIDGKPFRSALTELDAAPTTRRKKDYLRLGIGTTLNIMKDLTFDFDFMYSTIEERFNKNGGKVYGYNTFNAFTSLEALLSSYDNYIAPTYDYAYQDKGRTQMLTTNAFATYNLRLKEDHAFKFMVGTNLESNHYNWFSAQRNKLYDPDKPELNLAYGDQYVNSKHTHWAVAGFFGRINYAFKDRYLVELNGRYDGSSMLPGDDRFAFFPSFSLGYRITEENFMQGLKPILSNLKLRGSYGRIGNQDIGTNAAYSILTSTPKDNWVIDGKNTASMGTPSLVYSSLTWEKVTTIDFGLDARFWNDKIGVTFDWYRRTTSDVLAPSTAPFTLGSKAPKRNFGELETPGWELAVDFRHQFANGLTLTFSGQITDYYTKVTKWSDNTNIPTYDGNGNGWYSSTFFKKGMILGDIWGFKVDRILQESDFDASGNPIAGIPDQSAIFKNIKGYGPGDILYKDLDGDKKILTGTSTDKSNDQTIIGNMFPRYQYGFSIGAEYKWFDFNMFFQGVGKRKLWAAGNQVLPGYTSGEPYYKGAEDFWSPENPNAFYPRPTVYGQTQQWNYAVNDRYLLNMAYLRCKTLTIGYSLPKDLLRKISINKLRIYFTAENLFEFDNVKPDIDPEIDIRYEEKKADSRNFGRSYPYQRTISFGLQATF